MNAERTRILEMVAEGKMSAENADRLLQAIRKRPTVWQWLFRPLEVLETRTALLVSAGVAGLQLLASRLPLRFDGALDLHGTQAPAPWPTSLIELAVTWPLVALIFWGAARLVARQGRFVDFLAAVGIARLPLILAAGMLGVFHPTFEEAAGGQPGTLAMVLALLLVPIVVWFIALLVTGFRTASGLRGAKLTLTTIGVLIVAEAVSKLALVAF